MTYDASTAHRLLPPATWMLAAVARSLGLEAEQPEEKQLELLDADLSDSRDSIAHEEFKPTV